MRDRLKDNLLSLMLIPGLSGHESRVARHIKISLGDINVPSHTDQLGNLIATFEGEPATPAVMLFAHMDQLGFIVRKIAENGLIYVERVGGIPERALAAQAVTLCVSDDKDVPGVIANKSHHATSLDEKYTVVKISDLFIDAGFTSRKNAAQAGVRIGTPVVYHPRAFELAGNRIAGTSVDDRAGCAVLIEVAHALSKRKGGPTVHLVFSGQEEFNLRGAAVAAAALQPQIAIQVDLMLACDTPDMADRGEMYLGGGPGMSLYSFHGRGTINGVIPHPALVALFEDTAQAEKLELQRSAQSGILTDLSYVQTAGNGIAPIDIGFPMRYSHSALECCDLEDLVGLTRLILAALERIGPGFSLDTGR